MGTLRTICVYCGAESGTNPAFRTAAVKLGSMLARQDIEMIFGGGLNGLMGVTARAAIEAGGRVTGIIPQFLSHLAQVGCTRIIFAKSMHDRKQSMFDYADAFLALPGGIGTLEEVAEQLKWAQLGQHSKPIFLLNISDYWSPFLQLLEHMKQHNFLNVDITSIMQVCSSIEELSEILNSFRVPQSSGQNTT